jgi:hypothetical protein
MLTSTYSKAAIAAIGLCIPAPLDLNLEVEAHAFRLLRLLR